MNPGSLHRWRTGEKSPSPHQRQSLRDQFGIPIEAWGQSAKASRSTATPNKPPANPAAPKASELDTLSGLLQLLQKIQGVDIGGLLPSEQARVIDSELKVQALIYKIEADRRKLEALAEDRLTRHPAFKRYTRALELALRPYPDAADAVISALDEVQLDDE